MVSWKETGGYKVKKKTAGSVNIPDDLLKMVKNVKSNAVIVSSDESEIESNWVFWYIFAKMCQKSKI